MVSKLIPLTSNPNYSWLRIWQKTMTTVFFIFIMDHAWIIRTGENGNRGSNYDDPILTWISFELQHCQY